MKNVTITDVRQAAERIAGVVRRTPLERSRWLSKETSSEVSFKLECFQVTGSFKLRGAMAKLSAITDEERERGVLTISAGNHGLAVAHCSEALKLDTTIVVPRSASRAKVEAIRQYPVKLLELGAGYDEAERMARELERESGMTFVSPYNDPDVIAGQGTAAIEILEDYPDLEALVVPIGGGGLLAGVLVAAKAMKPEIEVYGVEPKTSPTMTAALAAGGIVQIDEDETIADGLAGNIEPGSITYPIIQRLVDGVILVTEDAIMTSIARIAREDHIIIEGAAATSIAALADERLKGKRVCAMVTGRNIALDLFSRVLEKTGSLRP